VTAEALARVGVPADCSLRTAFETVDRSGLHAALLLDADGSLAGVLTDGDLRRAVLAGADLDGPALRHATTTPQTVVAGTKRALVLDLMRALRISVVPEVDERGRPVGLHTLTDIAGVDPRPNTAVIMAGGRGTRLGPLTRSTPKPLLEVAGRSIIDWIVLALVGGGITDVCVSVNHLAEQVEQHLGDGSRLGCRVTYLRESADRPLGTAGSLALLRAARPGLELPVIVVNGDLMVDFEPAALLEAHAAQEAAITVATRNYQHEVPFGVVDLDGTRVAAIREKPTVTLSVNAGVYAVSPEVVASVPDEQPCTMPDLVQRCLDAGATVGAWPIASDWIDVGTPTDLARAKGHV
jgi:dTDP-glucose pyrophosphorylase